MQVGVRLTRDPETDKKATVPPVGSMILLDFYNGSRAAKRRYQTREEDICFGRVENLGTRAWHYRTDTEFCVLMTKPKSRALQLNFANTAVNIYKGPTSR